MPRMHERVCIALNELLNNVQKHGYYNFFLIHSVLL